MSFFTLMQIKRRISTMDHTYFKRTKYDVENKLTSGPTEFESDHKATTISSTDTLQFLNNDDNLVPV